MIANRWKTGSNLILTVGLAFSAIDYAKAVEEGDDDKKIKIITDACAGIICSRFGIYGIPMYGAYLLINQELPGNNGYTHPNIHIRDHTYVNPVHP